MGCNMSDGPVEEEDVLYPYPQTQFEPVHSPKHYMLFPGVEVIDVRKALLVKMDGIYSPIAIDMWSRSWEYLTRFMDKNGLEDLEKARVYLDWLINEVKKSQ